MIIPESLQYLRSQPNAGNNTTYQFAAAPVVNANDYNWPAQTPGGSLYVPVTLFVASKGQKILGFAAYECTRRGFLGPMGVAKSAREKGVGTALLLSAMHAMLEMGYVYGIIGGVGPVEFYRKTVGAVEIEGSEPGIYGNILRTHGKLK